MHTFPTDGLYRFHATLVRTVSGELFGNTASHMAGKKELLEISINGARAAVLEVDEAMNDAGEKGLTLETPAIAVKAGPQRIAAAFVPRSVGPVDDLLAPIDQTLIDTRIGTGYGVTMAPHLQEIAIAGPTNVTGVSETPSRQRIFTCRPASAAQERGCATSCDGSRRRPTVVRYATTSTTSSGSTRRRATTAAISIRGSGSASRASSRTPASCSVSSRPRRQPTSSIVWPISTSPRACRSSSGRPCRTRNCSRPPATARCALRRLRPAGQAHARRSAIARAVDAIASQWLRLQDADRSARRVALPELGRLAPESFVRETELFFDSIVRENRSVLDLITADYTFVNERLARHYGLPNVTGPEFRRALLPEPRRGLLTQGSILLLTSVADRTSPVQRGKWVLQVLLGAPPPPPPPNVPALEDTKASAEGRFLSVRQRMEQHRANPSCVSCHRVIDPLGLALENFDVVGRLRIKDNGVPVDSTGSSTTVPEMEGAAGLRSALLKHADAFLMTFDHPCRSSTRWRLWQRPRRRRPRKGHTRFVAVEMVHGAAGSCVYGAKNNLWSPAAVGRTFDLSPTSLAPLEPLRDYITIVSNTDARMAEAFTTPEIGGDHFRASSVFLTQAHPKQTMGSDLYVGTSFDQIYARQFGQDTAIPSMQLCIEAVDHSGGCE